MSLFLLIQDKQKQIDKSDFKNIVDEFSRFGKRNISEKIFGNTIMISAPIWSQIATTFEDKNHYIVLAGYITEYTGKEGNSKALLFNNPCKCVSDEFLISGIEMIRHFKGIFSICIFQKSSQNVFVFNDHYGLYPVFVYEDAQTRILCNEYEPIIKLSQFNNQIDKQSVFEYFTAGSIQGNRTFFKSITNLRPGHFTEITREHLSINKLPENSTPRIFNGSPDDLADEFHTIFKRSVHKRIALFNNAKPLISLTGGVDTRCITAEIPEQYLKSFQFITMITPPLQPETDSEFVIANQIAKRMGLNLEARYFDYWNRDFDKTFYNQLRTDNPEYIFTGHYGSEIYKAEFFYLIPEKVKRDFVEILGYPFYPPKKQSQKTWSQKLRSQLLFEEIFNPDFLKEIIPVEEIIDEEYKHFNNMNKELHFTINLITRSFFTNFWDGTRGLNLCQPYMTSQKFCCPFLDQDLISFILQVPYKYLGLGNNKIYTGFVERCCHNLLDIPTNSNYANHEGAVLKYFPQKIKPYDVRNPKYKKSFSLYLNDKSTWNTGVYSTGFKNFVKKTSDLKDKYITRFIDFEAWKKYSAL
jgi:hypothetical protein